MIQASDLIAKFQYALDNKWGYIYGCAGQLWTVKSQAETTNAMAVEYGSRWIGHHVADCSGLFSWAAAKLGGYLPHGSNSIYRKYCTATGTDMTNLQPGTAVFKCKSGTKYKDKLDYYHIGLYIGNNVVIEAKGTRYGVVTSKVKEWHAWGTLKGIDYGGDQSSEVVPVDIVPGQATVDVPNDGTVRVRSKPSTSGAVITTLPEGASVTVQAVDGDWARVKFEETGYIMTKFLKVGD